MRERKCLRSAESTPSPLAEAVLHAHRVPPDIAEHGHGVLDQPVEVLFDGQAFVAEREEAGQSLFGSTGVDLPQLCSVQDSGTEVAVDRIVGVGRVDMPKEV